MTDEHTCGTCENWYNIHYVNGFLVGWCRPKFETTSKHRISSPTDGCDIGQWKETEAGDDED